MPVHRLVLGDRTLLALVYSRLTITPAFTRQPSPGAFILTGIDYKNI